MILTLERVKQHLNLEPDFTEDDQYILGLIDMAEKAVRVHVNEDFKDIAKRNGGFPTPLLQAMLLMVGQMYMNWEIVGTKTEELPFNYQYLIDLYRNYNK